MFAPLRTQNPQQTNHHFCNKIYFLFFCYKSQTSTTKIPVEKYQSLTMNFFIYYNYLINRTLAFKILAVNSTLKKQKQKPQQTTKPPVTKEARTGCLKLSQPVAPSLFTMATSWLSHDNSIYIWGILSGSKTEPNLQHYQSAGTDPVRVAAVLLHDGSRHSSPPSVDCC